MLVLTLKIGEGVVLPGLGVRIIVADVPGKRVKLGITAPPEVAVRRSELRPADPIPPRRRPPADILGAAHGPR